MRDKYTAKWDVQMARMNFQTRSSLIYRISAIILPEKNVNIPFFVVNNISRQEPLLSCIMDQASVSFSPALFISLAASFSVKYTTLLILPFLSRITLMLTAPFRSGSNL